MNEEGQPTVEDLPPRERRRAQLPPLVSITSLIALVAIALVWYVQQQQAQDQKLIRYILNTNACNARKLIDKSIVDTKRALATYVDAAEDPTLTRGAKERNELRIRDANKSLVGLRAFRNLYVTAPLNYDCRKLPRKPPG